MKCKNCGHQIFEDKKEGRFLHYESGIVHPKCYYNTDPDSFDICGCFKPEPEEMVKK